MDSNRFAAQHAFLFLEDEKSVLPLVREAAAEDIALRKIGACCRLRGRS